MLGCIPSHVPNVLHKPNYFSIKLNLASYNYLGFADAYGACADSSVETVTTDSINATSSEQELGRMQIHDDLEKLTAKMQMGARMHAIDDCALQVAAPLYLVFAVIPVM